MSVRRDSFRIVKIRFVNFHNLGTGVVDLPGGGHLFLLGDNGSGKTTLLDAIHYVLSAGDIEFNAAARVAGAKNVGGRKVQGVVMRYNVEAGGPMNKDGGIAYAALELASVETGRTVSICVGLSATSMDVAYDSWGGMADAPVADLPLAVEDGDRSRAAFRDEFAKRIKALPVGHYFAKIGQYATAVAERFFDDAETYRNVCRILAIGKAYREIASKAGNLNELFRQLLEEPNRETFTGLVDGLRSIDESRERLDHIETRLGFLRKLKRGRDALVQTKENLVCAAWKRADIDLAEAVAREHELEAERAKVVAEINVANGGLDVLKRERDARQAELQDLKAKDASGLLQREKQLAQEAAALEGECRAKDDARRKASEALRDVAERVAESRRALAANAAKRAVELHKLGQDAPVSVMPLVSALDAVAKAAAPEESALETDAVRSAVASACEDAVGAVRACTDEAARADAEVSRIGKELAALEAQAEPEPEVPGFAEARTVVAERLFKAVPLYLHVEPRAGLKSAEVAAFEQVVGDALLGTWLVPQDEADAVRMEFFRNHREQSVFVRTEDFDVPSETEWVARYIDVAESNSDAVLAPKAALAARGGLRVLDEVETKVVAFRGREQPLANAKPRLLGARQRHDEQARRVRMKRDELSAAEKARDAAARRVREAESARTHMREIASTVDGLRTWWQEGCERVRHLRQEQMFREENAAGASRVAEEARNRLARAKEQLESVRLKMANEGVSAALERRIRSVENRIREIEGEMEFVIQKRGEATQRIQMIDSGLVASRERQRIAEANRIAAEKLLPGIAALAHERLGEAGNSRELLAAFAEEAKRKETEGETTLRRDICEPIGFDYAFQFDAAECSLVDQRGEAIDVVLEKENADYEAQRGVINEQTQRLFRDIFVSEVLRKLYEDDQRLTQLSVRVNRMLKDRFFGSSRYSFGLKPVPEYESLLALIRKFSAYGAGEDGEEISDFVETHKDAILSAQPGEIPEMFDYRHWYEFQLKMVTRDNDGKIIDRSVKAVGSGGEQAVPNYLLILTVAAFLYQGRTGNQSLRLQPLLFDEAFYGIDAARRDQLLSFANDLGLQLFVASPDQDGVKKELPRTTSLFVVKDEKFDVHLYHYTQDITAKQGDLFSSPAPARPDTPEFTSVGTYIKGAGDES